MHAFSTRQAQEIAHDKTLDRALLARILSVSSDIAWAMTQKVNNETKIDIVEALIPQLEYDLLMLERKYSERK